jgi:hypothetical protein
VSGARAAQREHCTTTRPKRLASALARDCRADVYLVHWYQCTKVRQPQEIAMPVVSKRLEIERVQTGVRMERRVLKVLKALAEYKNITLGDLLEGIVLHAFEGKAPFSAETVRKIAELKNIYELDLDARASHRLKEK